MSNKLIEAINYIAEIDDSEKVPIGKGLYVMVAKRVEIFRKHYADNARIDTEILSADLERVCMKATATVYKDGQWRVIGTGHAEEYRGANFINKTSALENCETSAIGRCLASLGIHGGEYASAFEVENAIENKAEPPKAKYDFVSAEGKSIFPAKEPTMFLEACRKFLKNDADKKVQELFKKNQDTIQRALDASDGLYDKDNKSVKEAFENLIKVYDKAD
tara:strand:- start:5877 stop:6536 length:660 start_codon:yes stop_codon:yes gene_type:complete